jgi:hypothetical protein
MMMHKIYYEVVKMSSTNTSRFLSLFLTAMLLFSMGCASSQFAYRPSTIGISDPAEIIDGLEVNIQPNTDSVEQGSNLLFLVTIRNISDKAIWIPRRPHVLFFWTYSDGQRDHFLDEYSDTVYYDKQSCMLLKPGQQLKFRKSIRTAYFLATGITEFRAVYVVENNKNTALQPFWQGELLSNAYGVMVHDS